MTGIHKFLLVLMVVGACACFPSPSFAQSPRASASPPVNAQQSDDRHENDVDFGSRETDARTRLILRAEKKAYEEHVARAKEASDLAGELKTRSEERRV